MKNKKIIVGTLFLSCLTLGLTGCGKEVTLKNGEKPVVTYKKGEITSDELYKELKERYGISALIELLDHELFDKAYKTDDEETEYVNSQVSQMKSQYNNDQEQFENAIKSYLGLESETELRSLLSLEYKRDKAIKDTIKAGIKDDEINAYYNDTVIGDITAKHILIKPEVTDDMTADEKEEAEKKALETAKEVIKKLDKGEKFEDLVTEYSDDAATVENEGELDPFNHDSGMDENFLKAAIGLEKGKYTKEPVKSTYGYHIILKVKQAKKPELKKIKDTIIETLVEDKINNDATERYNALMKAREDKGLKFEDDELKKDYDEYMKNLIDSATAQ